MPVVGESLGRYTLLKKLAVGGMGEIFVAAKTGPLGLGAPVALKVLREEFTKDQNFVDMLVDEANICRFLSHQNVVSVTDFGEDQGNYFITMEYVQGVTLQYILEQLRKHRKRMPLGLSLFVQVELCRALRHAHTRKNYAGEPLNIIHRDVTPGNILLSIQGEVKLTDFGIARAKGRTHKTQAGILKGKFGYMAPEMIRQEEIDARADIFCAGIVFYEMLTTRHPAHNATLIEAITAFENQTYKPPSAYNKHLSSDLDAIVMKALAPKPAERWPDIAALGTAIQEIIVSDKSIRSIAGNGGPYLTKLIKKFNPEVFESPMPKDPAKAGIASTWIPDKPEGQTPDPLAIAPTVAPAEDLAGMVTLKPNDNSEQATAHVIDAIDDTDRAEAATSSNTEGLSPVTPISEERTIDASELSGDELQALVEAGTGMQEAGPAVSEEIRPYFEEGVLATQEPLLTPSDYDDGPTAFSPAPDEALIRNATPLSHATTSPTPVADARPQESHERSLEPSNDATLLGGLSIDELEFAKREYEKEQQRRAQETQDAPADSGVAATDENIPAKDLEATDDNLDATRIRLSVDELDALIPSSLAAVSKSAKALEGPLRVRVTENQVEASPEPEGETLLSLPGPSEQVELDTTLPPSSERRVLAVNEADIPATLIPEDLEPDPMTIATPHPDFPSQRPPEPAASDKASAKPPTARGANPWLLPSLTVLLLLIVLGMGFALLSDQFWPRLTLISTPSGAQIILNQRQTQGISPVTVKVKPFVAHEIEFRLAGHHALVERIEAGLLEKRLIEVQLVAAEHFIHIKPRAGHVFINDRRIGVGERIEFPSIDALGQIEIKVEASGYKTWIKRFNSAKEVPHTLKVRLQKK